MTRNI